MCVFAGMQVVELSAYAENSGQVKWSGQGERRSDEVVFCTQSALGVELHITLGQVRAATAVHRSHSSSIILILVRYVLGAGTRIAAIG